MTSSSPERIRGLDGLRALAALAIVLHHAGFQAGTTFDGWHGRFLGRLDVGVPIFFALSGFLLFLPIANSVLHDRPLRPALEHLWRRAMRIYPAFLFALLAIVVFTSEAFGSVTGGVVTALLVHIHFPTHTIGPMPQAWSLATEISFYAFLPLLARFLRPWLAHRDFAGRRNGLFVMLAVGSIASIAFRTLILGLDNRWTSAAVHWLPATFDYFAIGMAMAVARVAFANGTPSRERLDRWANPAGLWWLAAGGFFVVVSQFAGLELGLNRASWDRELIRQFLYGAIALCLLFPLVFGDRDGSAVRQLVRSRPLEGLGLISYSIYLWHLAFISHPFGPLESMVGGLELFDRKFWPVVFVAMVPTLVVSWLSYAVIERAGLVAQRWITRPVLDPTPTESLISSVLDRWRSWSFRRQIGLLSAIGLVWRVVYVIAAKRDQTLDSLDIFPGDQFYYSRAADALARGEGFVTPWHDISLALGLVDPGSLPTHAADHPPLTAIAMAPASLFPGGPGEHLFEQRLLMCVIGAAVIAVIGYLGRAVAGPTVGRAAAAIAAVYPGFWINDALVMSETLTTLMIAGLLWAVVIHRRQPGVRTAAVMGAMLALAGLARSESLLLGVLLIVPVVLAADAAWRDRLLRLTTATSVTLLVLAPWVGPNLVRFDEPVTMSTNDGLTLIGANSPQTYSGDAIGFWSLEHQQSLIPAIPELAGADASVESGIWRDEAFAFIGDNLDQQPQVMAARLGRAWSVYRPLQTIDFNTGEGRELWASNLALIGLALVAPFAVFGWWRLGRDKAIRWPFTVLVGHVSLIAMLFYGIPRFRVPAEIGIVVAAAVAMVALGRVGTDEAVEFSPDAP